MVANHLNSSIPIVAVFSPPNALSLELIKQILGNFCLVKVISDQPKKWGRHLDSIKNNKRVEFVDRTARKKIDCHYVVAILFCGDGKYELKSLRSQKKIIDNAGLVAKKNSAKALFVLPFKQENVCQKKTLLYLKNKIKNEKSSFGIVFVGHVLDKNAFFYQDNLLTQTLKIASDFHKLKFNREKVIFYPVKDSFVAKNLIKTLFSFTPDGFETAFITKPLRLNTLSTYLKKIQPELKIKKVYPLKKGRVVLPTPKVENVKIMTGNLEVLVGNYFNKLKNNKFQENGKRFIEKGNFILKRLSQNRRRKSKITIFPKIVGLVILMIIFSFTLVLISFFSLTLAPKGIRSGNLGLAKKILSVSCWTGQTAETIFEVYESIPMVGFSFEGVQRTTQTLVKTTKIGESVVKLTIDVLDLIDRITKEKLYDQDKYVREMSLELDYLYQELGFLQTEVASSPIIRNLFELNGIEGSDISSLRDKVYYLKKIVIELPELLGKKKDRVYLVLLQDNLELRPTGGVIDSLALLKFSQGRLVNIDVQDVSSLDGQLQGQVEPPYPIKNYLGESNWFLRDSNWDADFPTSAKQAAWFLEKEVGQLVDGVVSLDLKLIKDWLETTGPLVLSNFNQEITSENLDEIVQADVKASSSSGLPKKANFLTGLLRETLARLTNLSLKQKVKVVETLLVNLAEKHVQIFFSNFEAQKATSSLGWSGETVNPVATENHFADWVGMVEANIGVNRLNYFIKRSAKMEIDLRGSEIKRRLAVVIENDNQETGKKSDRYRTYLRILVPTGNIFGPVEIFFDGKKELIEAELNNVRQHQEAGVLVEVLPRQKKQIDFFWEIKKTLDFKKEGTYLMFWRKQAGTLSDPILINYLIPPGLIFESSPPLSLTEPDVFGYNTELSRDFVSQIYW